MLRPRHGRFSSQALELPPQAGAGESEHSPFPGGPQGVIEMSEVPAGSHLREEASLQRRLKPTGRQGGWEWGLVGPGQLFSGSSQSCELREISCFVCTRRYRDSRDVLGGDNAKNGTREWT